MALFVLILFVINLSLLFVHEMDASHNAEWRMFPFLKRMPDSAAGRLFTALHIPLYALVLYLLTGGYPIAAYYIVDLFLLLHTALHVLFAGHRQNHLTSPFSLAIIYSMGILSALHLVFRVWWH